MPASLVVAAILAAGGAMAAIRLLALGIQSAGISLRASAALELAAFACSLLVWLWAMGGLVRLGLRRLREGERASAAAALAGAVLLSAGLGFHHREEASHLPQLLAIAGGGDPMGGPAAVRLSPDGRVVLLDGLLAQGSARAFARVLDAAPRARRLVLRSEGGRIHEAEEIARLVGGRGLDTHVEDYCHSACTDILLAGRRRTASWEAKLGFHQPASPGLSSGEAWLRAREALRRYSESGVAADFAEKAAATPAEAMWFPSAAELLDAGFLTRIDVSAPLRRLAEEEDSASPRMLDGATRLDRASADGGVLAYTHTVLGARGGRFRADAALERRLTEETCVDEGLAALVGAGAVVRYLYRDSAGRPLGEVAIASCEAEG